MGTGLAPSRPDEASSQRRIERRWVPPIAVVAVLFVLIGAGRTVADAIAGPPGSPFEISSAVLIHPAAGWARERIAERPGVEAVVLARGTAVLQVSVLAGDPRPPEDVLASYEGEVLGRTFAELAIGRPEEATVGGAPAVQVGYLGRTASGVPVEGLLVATVTPSGASVVFDAAAPQGDLAWAADDIVAMIRTAELR